MIFFDLDGTLLDHAAAEDAAARAFCDRHRDVLGPSSDTFVHRWRALIAKHYARYLAGELTHLEQRRARMSELFGSTLAAPDLDERFAWYLAEYRVHWNAFDDVAPTLDALASHPLGVITNGHASQQQEKLRHLGIADHFTVLATPDVSGAAKPSPEIFVDAARRAGCPPSACVYVGDDLDLDARAATAAGMRGVWLNRVGADAPSDTETITTLALLPGLLAHPRLPLAAPRH